MAINPDVLSKLRKILAMTQDGGNAEEAVVAMSKAREMMLKYQVDMADLVDIKTEASSVIQQRVVVGAGGHQPIEWRRGLFTSIAKFADCVFMFYLSSCNGVLVGRTDDIQLGIELFAYVTAEFETLAIKSYDKDKAVWCGSNLKGWRTEFCMAAAIALSNRLHALKLQVDESLGAKSTALVLVKSHQVETYVNEAFPKRKKLEPTYRAYWDDAHRAGRIAGNNVDISRSKRLS